MARRRELQTLLESIQGAEAVYYQPPENLKIVYPCIVYQRENERLNHADNQIYWSKNQYQLTVIDRKPDSEIAERVATLPYCRMNRAFSTSNLHHHVFTIYF